MRPNDSLVFSNGSQSSLQALGDVMKKYMSILGQLINKEKSIVFFPIKATVSRKMIGLNALGFSKAKFLYMYLGAPIHSGKLLVSTLKPVLPKLGEN